MRTDSFFQRNRYLFFLVFFMILGTAVMMLPAALKGEWFVGGGDIKTQWDPFYTLNRRETIDALRQGKLPFYSWILFLGTNLWASKASYGLFDIFNVLTYPLGASYLYIYPLLCFVKMIVSAVSMYLYLDTCGITKKHCLLGGLMYGFSSYAVYYTSEFGFLSFYCLLPLYFLALERYLKEGRMAGFSIMVFLLFLTNYYLFFSATALTPFYFLFRYYVEHKSFRGWFLSALRLIGAYFIGFLMAGAVVLPVVSFVLQNSRVGSGGLSWSYDDIKIYLHLLTALFVPSQTYIFGNNVYDHISHNMKEICFFTSSLTCVLLPQIIRREKTKRTPVLVLVFLFTLILILPPLGSLLNGMSGASFRWSPVLIILNIITVSEILDSEEIDKRLLVLTGVIETAIIVTCFAAALILRGESLSSYPAQIPELLSAVVFTIVYIVLLQKGRRKLLVPVLCLELFLYAGIFGYRVHGTDAEHYSKARNVIADSWNKDDFMNNMNWLEEGNESSFYRVFVPYESAYWYTSRNMNIYYNLPGVMTYDSTYEPSFDEMKDIGNISSVKEIAWEFSVEDPDLLDFLSVKYAVTLSEDEIPFEHYEILDDDYRGFLLVSKNTDYVPVGRTRLSVIDKASYNGDPALLREAVITDRADELNAYISSAQSSDMYNISYSSNTMRGEIDCDGPSYLVTSIPYDRGWKILVNGAEVPSVDNVNCGFTGFKLPSGHSTVEMYFIPPGFKAGALMSVAGAADLVVLMWIQSRRKKS